MNLNGNGIEDNTSNNHFEPKIDFPVTYILKVVVDVNHPGSNPEILVKELLKQQQIAYRWVGEKKSGKNNFQSYSIEITLISRESMQRLYSGLKTIKSVKLAI